MGIMEVLVKYQLNISYMFKYPLITGKYQLNIGKY